MSTGIDQSKKDNHLTFDSIDRHVREFDAVAFMSEGAVQTSATATDRLVTVFGAVRPILTALLAATIPLIPAAWRAVLTIFVSTLDDVSASFKAGKDLATAPVNVSPKADMEPKLPVG
jgi:anaerobic glycerol-3-phosphate dehydrogenase